MTQSKNLRNVQMNTLEHAVWTCSSCNIEYLASTLFCKNETCELYQQPVLQYQYWACPKCSRENSVDCLFCGDCGDIQPLKEDKVKKYTKSEAVLEPLVKSSTDEELPWCSVCNVRCMRANDGEIICNCSKDSWCVCCQSVRKHIGPYGEWGCKCDDIDPAGQHHCLKQCSNCGQAYKFYQSHICVFNGYRQSAKIEALLPNAKTEALLPNASIEKPIQVSFNSEKFLTFLTLVFVVILLGVGYELLSCCLSYIF